MLHVSSDCYGAPSLPMINALRATDVSAICPLSRVKRKTEPFRFRPRSRTTATSIRPSLNVKTVRSRRGIVPFTHLAREGRMTVTIGRRELLAALGGAAAGPLAARAQQAAMPVIGLLSTRSPVTDAPLTALFQQALRETGFVGDRNVVIDYRWADGQYD